MRFGDLFFKKESLPPKKLENKILKNIILSNKLEDINKIITSW